MGNAVESAFIEYDFAKAGYVHDKNCYDLSDAQSGTYWVQAVCTCSINTSKSILEYLWKEGETFYYKDCNEWWYEQWSHAGRYTFELIEKNGQDKLQEFKQEIFKEFEKEHGSGGIPFQGDVLIAIGQK